MTNLPYCAHVRVSWRTENYEADIEATEAYPGGRHVLTRGWWECDTGCGTRFDPVAPPSIPSTPNPELEELLNELERRVELFVEGPDCDTLADAFVYRQNEKAVDAARSELVSLYSRLQQEVAQARASVAKMITILHESSSDYEAELSRLRDTERQLREENEILRIRNSELSRSASPGDTK